MKGSCPTIQIWFGHPLAVSTMPSRPSADAAGLGRGPVPPASAGVLLTSTPLCARCDLGPASYGRNGRDGGSEGPRGGGHPWCARPPRSPRGLPGFCLRQSCTMQAGQRAFNTKVSQSVRGLVPRGCREPRLKKALEGETAPVSGTL